MSENISACIGILGILERYKCSIELTSFNEKKVIVEITMDNDDVKFPEMLFGNAIKKFEATFNVIVDF